MYSWLAFSTIFNALTSILGGIFIYRKNPKNPIHRRFATLCFFTGFWAVSYFFPFTPESKELSWLSFEWLHVGAAFVAVAHLHFVCAVTNRVETNRLLITWGYIFNLAIVPFIFTKYFIVDMVPKYEFTYWAEPGVVYHVWLGVWISYFVYGLSLLFLSYKKSSGVEKLKLKHLFQGHAIMFTCGSTNYFLFYDIHIPPYLDIAVSGFILHTIYSILRYRFLDITITLSNAMRNILATACSTGIAYGVIASSRFFFPDLSAPYQIIFGVVTSIVSYKGFSHFFYSAYFSRFVGYTEGEFFIKTLDEFQQRNSMYTGLNELQDSLQKVFCEELHLNSVKLVLRDEKDLKIPSHLSQHLEKDHKALVTKEVEYQEKQKNTSFRYTKQLQKFGEVCLPLFHTSGKLIGFFVLGSKQFGDTYSSQELDVLDRLARFLSLTLTGILYNHEIRKEVDEKTEALKDMLKQQIDFINITAHELRTPLSVMRFAYENLKESLQENQEMTEDAEMIGEGIARLREVSERMISVQRYDAGIEEVNRVQVYVHKFFEDMHKTFTPLMKEKSLHFILENKVSESLKVTIDTEKIECLLENLMTNAIRHTPKNGTILLESKEEKVSIFFSVNDTGEGIPAKDRKGIFRRFGVRDAIRAPGTGLGLYLSQKIVQLHEGEIWADKSELGGARFCVRLPKDVR